MIRDMLAENGHTVAHYQVIHDEAERVRQAVVHLCARPDVQAVLLTGGTGLAPRDTTFEAIISLLEKRIDGFGELFRSLSFAEIGAAAMLSRAVAGIRNHRVVFSMPGSVAAVKLAMTRLILPEMGHMVWLIHPR